MRVVFDEKTLAQSDNPSTSITGVVYFELDGAHFPAERWNDFVVVITSWWLEALEALERGEQESVLRFMDGPYSITLAKLDGNTVLARCIEDRRDAGIRYEESTDFADLARQLRDLGRQLVSACSRRGMTSRDLEVLKDRLPG
jgi:hypothetical protein